MGTETDTAWCPDWYTFLQAAKYIGCKPWELAEQSIYWRDKAVIAMNAEAEAREFLNKRNQPAS